MLWPAEAAGRDESVVTGLGVLKQQIGILHKGVLEAKRRLPEILKMSIAFDRDTAAAFATIREAISRVSRCVSNRLLHWT